MENDVLRSEWRWTRDRGQRRATIQGLRRASDQTTKGAQLLTWQEQEMETETRHDQSGVGSQNLVAPLVPFAQNWCVIFAAAQGVFNRSALVAAWGTFNQPP
jgi:hypothetical protein